MRNHNSTYTPFLLGKLPRGSVWPTVTLGTCHLVQLARWGLRGQLRPTDRKVTGLPDLSVIS